MVNEKIVVTGSSGQLGTRLIPNLLKLGYRVIGIDINSHKKDLKYIFLEADLTKKESLSCFKDILNDAKIAIHLAGKINDSQKIRDFAEESINLDLKGSINLLECLPNLQQLCYSSSYMVYGPTITNPINEDHPTNPSNVYGACKLLTEKYLNILSQKLKITLVILRFMGIYGPGTPLSGRAIPSFINMINSNKNPILFGNGLVRKNHVYIDDAIQAIINSITTKKTGIFNIGGKDAPNNKELIFYINQIFGKDLSIKYVENDIIENDFIMDYSLATKEIGFIPTIEIQKGLKTHILDFKEKHHEHKK